MTRSITASLYDDDFFAWTQEQASALRRLAGGEDIDIAHVAEEIEDLGKRDLREVNSCLARLIEHMLKIDDAPRSRDAAHWRREAVHFQISAHDAFSPSMRRLMTTEGIWKDAIRLARAAGITPPSARPDLFTIEELVADDFDLEEALAKLASASSADARP